MKKPLICILGRTGSGKSTLADAICKHYGLKQLKSYTTRAMRHGEETKADHLFISKEEAESYQKIAYSKIGEDEYFTTVDMLEQSDVYVIDPIGVADLRKRLPNRMIYEIYIRADESSTSSHLEKRQDSMADRTKRITSEQAQFDTYEQCAAWDILIENSGAIENAVRAIYNAYATLTRDQYTKQQRCECGGKRFSAYRICKYYIVVDNYGSFVSTDNDDPWSDDPDLYDIDGPYGPFKCLSCGKEYPKLPKRVHKDIFISESDYDAIKKILNKDESIGKKETMSFTADFEDGNSMVIEIGRHMSELDNRPWAQAFIKNSKGERLSYSNIAASENIFGAWDIPYADKMYRVNFDSRDLPFA